MNAPLIDDAALRALSALDHDMREVDRVIGERLASRVALVEQIGRYIVSAGGKRVRPRLVLLSAKAMGFSGPERFELAATVEFIHTATLLHDDVVDESMLRRGRATANAQYGNAASVLVGDFLYSRAFQMMVSVNQMRVLDILAEATNVIAEGEVLQLMNMNDAELGIDDYLQVIRYKTAKLFEASARLGAVLGGATAEQEEASARYGRHLGTAFQLIDDLLDYQGESEALGKNVGDDLREGKATLPILIALQRATPDQKALLRGAIENGYEGPLDEILAIIRSTGALESTLQAAQDEARLALDALLKLPESDERAALELMARQSTGRTS